MLRNCWCVLWNEASKYSPAGGQTLFCDGGCMCLSWQTALSWGLMGPDCLDLQEGLPFVFSGDWAQIMRQDGCGSDHLNGKGQYKLIRQFISDSEMFHNGPISDHLPYKAPQCGSKYLMSCTKLQIKRLALTVINHSDCDARINYATCAATLITSSLHPLIHLMYSLLCFL